MLADFTLDQVRELNRRYGFPLSNEGELERFYALLGGQPFLTQRGLHQMTERGLPFLDFTAGAARDEGPYGDHLRRIFVSLNQDASLCEVVRTCNRWEALFKHRIFLPLAEFGYRGRRVRPGHEAATANCMSQYLSRHLI